MKIAISKITLGLFALLVAGSTASAQEAVTLKNLLAKKIITLDRPLMVFHYSGRDANISDSSALRERVKAGAARFFDANYSTGNKMTGPGLYAAVDPAVTRADYGLEDPQLFVMTLKPGTQVLDVRDDFVGADAVAYKKIIQQLQCSAPDSAPNPNPSTLRLTGSKRCLGKVLKTYKELNIAAILYPFAGATGLKGCRASRFEAFHLIDGSAFDDENFAFYSNRLAVETNPKMRPFIATLFNEAMQDPRLSVTTNPLSPLAPLEAEKPLETDEYEIAKAETIWKCGSARPNEASENDAFLESAVQVANGDGYWTELLQTSKAYKKAFKGATFDIHQLKAILQKQYTALQIGSDSYSQWLEARRNAGRAFDGAETPGTEGYQATMQRLFEVMQEPLPKNEVLNQQPFFFASIKAQIPKGKQDIYFKDFSKWTKAYKAQGIGPRSATFFVNQILEIPYIIGLVPADENADGASLISKNRRAVIEILRSCRAMYLEASKSPAAIQGGLCGMESR